jgi:hypothetical protein
MRLPRTVQFDDESRRFALAYCCEECGHFDPSAEHCRHDWPNALHRRMHAAGALPVAGAEVTFCKEFELT